MTMPPEALDAFRDAENRRRASAADAGRHRVPGPRRHHRLAAGGAARPGTPRPGLPAVARPHRTDRPPARAPRPRRRVRRHGRAERLDQQPPRRPGCPRWSCRSSTASSPPAPRCRPPSTTAGTCCATWCATPRSGGRPGAGRGLRRERRLDGRPPWPRSGPGESGLTLRAQVLVNPCVDLTSTALDYPSMTEHAHSPTLTVTQMELFRRLAVPDGTDAARGVTAVRRRPERAAADAGRGADPRPGRRPRTRVRRTAAHGRDTRAS